jgi:hypothetical protein
MSESVTHGPRGFTPSDWGHRENTKQVRGVMQGPKPLFIQRITPSNYLQPQDVRHVTVRAANVFLTSIQNLRVHSDCVIRSVRPFGNVVNFAAVTCVGSSPSQFLARLCNALPEGRKLALLLGHGEK